MKKYTSILLAFVFIFSLFSISNINLAKASNCAPGESYNTSTGQPCSTPTQSEACAPGDLFSSVDGRACGVSVRTTPVNLTYIQSGTQYNFSLSSNQVFDKVVISADCKNNEVAISSLLLGRETCKSFAVSLIPTTGIEHSFYLTSKDSSTHYISLRAEIYFQGAFLGTSTINIPVYPSNGNGSGPVISGVKGPQTLDVNQQGTWTVSAYSKNGGNLSYQVSWGDEGYYSPAVGGMVSTSPVQQSATFTHTYVRAGTYNPTFTVTSQNSIYCTRGACPSSIQSATASLSVNVGNIPTPKYGITVTSPNGGETWATGTTQTISWQDSTPRSLIACPVNADCAQRKQLYNISIISETTKIGNIIANYVSGSSYSWPVGKVLEYDNPIKNDAYRIQVCLQNNPNICDTSDNYFKIGNGVPPPPSTMPSLKISLDPSTPAGQVITAGQTNITFAKIKITAGPQDVNNLSAIQIASDSVNVNNIFSTISNFRIYDGTTQIGSASSQLVSNGNYYYVWIYNNPISIPANTSKTLSIVADTLGGTSGFTSSSVRFGIAGWTFSYPGASVDPFGTAIYGNTFSILTSPTTPSSITVLYPKGGETLVAGTTYTVTVSANPVGITNPTVKLQLLQNGILLGSFVQFYLNSNGPSGPWPVGKYYDSNNNFVDAIPGTSYQIQAVLFDGNTVKATGNSGMFTIIPTPPPVTPNVNVALGKPVTSLSPGDPNYTSPASNLTDGDQNTMAYPAGYNFSYEVDLGSLQNVSKINAIVKNFGFNSPNIYITGWEILGLNGTGQWIKIADGGTPSANTVSVPSAVPISKIRISAKSTTNWIGIYELEAYAPAVGGGSGGGTSVDSGIKYRLPPVDTVILPPTNGSVQGAESFTFTQKLQLGSSGKEVVELQKYLSGMGYYSGSVDGNFGLQTQTALIKFEVAKNFTPDGIVGTQVRAVLNQ